MKSKEELSRLFTVVNGTLYRDGKEVGYKNKGGYLITIIDGRTFYVHRVIYQMLHGDLTREDVIDHIDGDPLNNRTCNLRKGTQGDNMRNKRHNRETGRVGCYYNKQKGKWQAQVMVNGERFYLGSFKEEQDAVEAYAQFVKSCSC